MKTLVIDTSIIVKWLSKTNEADVEKADLILKDAQDGKVELYAPELAKYEVGNVLLLSKKLTAREANVALGTASLLPITFIPESLDLANEAFSIASKLGITYYDASFISLAKYYDAILVTENIKHQGKAAVVESIALKDYK